MEVITKEVLEKLADGLHPKYSECELYEYGGFELIVVDMASELLTLRKQVTELIEDGERLEKVAKWHCGKFSPNENTRKVFEQHIDLMQKVNNE